MYKRHTTIEYNGDKEFCVGDFMYKAEIDDSCSYHSTCRACKGEKVLTVNGITFQCPCCEQEEAVVEINHYSISEYFVTQIAERMQTKSSANQTVFDPSNKIIEIQLINKNDSFISFCENISFNKETGFINGTDNWFDNKKSAEEFVKSLNCSELNKLAKYNKEHGTDFPVPVFKKEG